MTQELINRLRLARFFPENASVLAAVSGGADSMALLTFLHLNREALGFSGVVAAHFNHGLRDSARRDELFVREYCDAHGIPCLVGSADVRAEAEASRHGVEEAARRLRYAFLRQAAGQSGCDRICTGHTADDNAETVLMNLSRGAGLRGLSGIPPVRGFILRPLLTVSRAEVEAYLRERDIPYVTDETNADRRFRRNRVRHELVPGLRGINPRLTDAVTRMTQTLREDEDCLAALSGQVMTRARRVSEGYALDAHLLSELHPAIGKRVARLMYELAGGPPQALTQQHIARMTELFPADTAPGARITLPGGVVARRIYTEWVVGMESASPVIPPAALAPGQTITLPELGYSICCRAMRPDEKVHNSFNSFVISSATIKGSLLVRSRAPGDRIAQPGRNGAKTLKKLFIESKIPHHRRSGVAVFSDEEGVAAVMGFGPDVRCAAESAENAWEISFEGMEECTTTF